jgi:hypothetical protein
VPVPLKEGVSTYSPELLFVPAVNLLASTPKSRPSYVVLAHLTNFSSWVLFLL